MLPNAKCQLGCQMAARDTEYHQAVHDKPRSSIRALGLHSVTLSCLVNDHHLLCIFAGISTNQSA